MQARMKGAIFPKKRVKGASLGILTASSASLLLGFFIGISFSLHKTPEVQPVQCQCGTSSPGSHSNGEPNSTFRDSSNLILGALRSAEATSSVLQLNATPESQSETVITSCSNRIPSAAAERLPPGIVVSESDLHLRRIWGNPAEDTGAGKYLLALTVGYAQRANVNATVHKFSDKFDVVLFHYDGKTTEWDDEFPSWSKKAVHISARKQTKWWYAKRFLHPSIVAPYDYVFLWDEDLDIASFDAGEYLRIAGEHGLRISQPALDVTTGGTRVYDVTVRRTGGEVHRHSCGPGEPRYVPCSGFVEVMAPVFAGAAWACVWHMLQNDLVHAWGLDYHFWRCVDDPQEQIGVVDAQFVVHRGVPTLLAQEHAGDGGGSGSRDDPIKDRQFAELDAFTSRMKNAEDKAHQAALLSANVKAQAQAEAPPPQDGYDAE